MTQELKPILLEVKDESHKHASHAAMRGSTASETHFEVLVGSSAFEGMPLIERHRLVNQILDEELKASVHALSIKAKTPK